jgi:hypothetical protein
MGVGFQDSSALESQSLSRVSSVNVMITVLRFKEAAEACMPNPNDGQKHKAETQQVPYALRAPRPHSGLGSDTVLSTHRLHTHAYRPSRRRLILVLHTCSTWTHLSLTEWEAARGPGERARSAPVFILTSGMLGIICRI